MAEDDIDEVEDDDGNPLVGNLRSQLKASGKRTKELEAEVEAGRVAQRRIAFLDAEIPDTKQSRYFREHYDGPLDPEAIKTAAAEHGFVDDTPDPGTQSIDAQSDAAYGATGNVSMGSDDEFNAEVERAAREAPRGFTSQAIADVFKKHNRHAAS